MYKLQITWQITVTNSVQMKSGFCHWCTAYGQDGGSLQQTAPDFCHWLVWMYKPTMRQWITVAHWSVKTITDQSGCTHWWTRWWINVTNWSWCLSVWVYMLMDEMVDLCDKLQSQFIVADLRLCTNQGLSSCKHPAPAFPWFITFERHADNLCKVVGDNLLIMS